jgi:hypothetical protein
MDPDNQFLFDIDTFNGSFKITIEYDQSFNDHDLGRCLFGPAAVTASTNTAANTTTLLNNSCNSCDDIILNIVGSANATAPNGTTDLVADNFFLPGDYRSMVTIKPEIQNVNVHLQAYLGFDEWCTGLYLRLYFPITWSNWKLEATETKVGTAVASYAAGEISTTVVGPTNLQTSFLNYTTGTKLSNLPGGEMVQPLLYNLFGGCESNNTTQVADFRAEFGWNFLLDEDYHLGLYIAAAAPTGRGCGSDCNNLLWGAKAGNGNHWELGGGLTAHYTLWRSEDDEQQFDLCIDATINHMFQHSEQHTFDLNNKPLSRYIIAEKLTTAATGLLVAGTQAKLQFGAVYAPVANFSTFEVDVSIPVQADVLAKFVYTCRGFSWELGYDFWGQSCPNVDIDCDCPPAFPANTWALKGDAHVYGFQSGVLGNPPAAIPATYNATTAFNLGTPFESGTPADSNAGVDNPATPVTFGTNTLTTTPAGTVAIAASNQPVAIALTDINLCSTTSHGISNSIFTEFNYTWIDRECWVPYLGLGVKVEFGSTGNDCNNVVATNTTVATTTVNCNECDNCASCAVTKWAIWIQGGVSFN